MSEATRYSILVTRTDGAGNAQHFEFEGYGLLRELMDDIEVEAEKRGWFEDAVEPAIVTEATLAELKEKFGVTTDAEVIRKAMSLIRVERQSKP